MAAEDYIDLTDPPDYSDVDFIYRTPRNKFNRKEHKMKNKKINKYYVGATHIAEAISHGANAEWTCETEAQAIAHAKRLMEDEDRDIAIVTKITHIIRRGKMPLSIEKLK